MDNEYDETEYTLDELRLLFDRDTVHSILSTTLVTRDNTYEQKKNMWNSIEGIWEDYLIRIRKVGINRYTMVAISRWEK